MGRVEEESIAPAGQVANCKYPNRQVHPESEINEKWDVNDHDC